MNRKFAMFGAAALALSAAACTDDTQPEDEVIVVEETETVEDNTDAE